MNETYEMKVAIIGSKGYPYVYGGYETFVKELGERLVKREVEVTVYCHASLFPKQPKEVNGIKLVYVPAIEVKSLSQLTHSFLSMCHAALSNANVILVVNSANGPFGLIARIFRKRTLINVDGMEWLRPKWKGLGAKYFYWASMIATKFYDLIINDSDAMKEVYLSEFNADSKVIAYGANIRFSKDPSKLKRWNIKPGEYYLVVARMVPDNNIRLLAEGFSKSRVPNKLVIVGDVTYKDRYADDLKAFCKKDPRILLTGYVTDAEELAELYHNAYVYLHGHEHGGTNPAMLKALAYGCAIFALDTVFNKEMLQDGKHGLFFQKNSDSLKDLIEMHDPKKVQELRAIARDGITDKYDWDSVTSKYIQAMKSLLL